MKVLFIGGTGNISTATSKLAIEKGIDLFHFNRGQTPGEIPGVTTIVGNISSIESAKLALKDYEWDVVVNWIAFDEQDITRDFDLFERKTKQYIFISSASCYQKPAITPYITESTPLSNPYWDYSQNKIKAEEALMAKYRQNGFPITIVRPSLTYDTVIPITIGGFKQYTTADRMLNGKEIIVPGDGNSVWTITHADDFAKGFVGLLGLRKAIGHAFHITSDELLTWNAIFEMVGEALGVKPNIVHISSDFICEIEPEFTGTLLGDKAVSCIFDNTKIKTFVPEFKAIIPFSQGIKRTFKWFDANPEKKLIDPQTNEKIERILAAYQRN